MTQMLTVGAEFLRRALGFGQEGDPEEVRVTPGTLPPDFPLLLPEWPGRRVLGGVQGAARRWRFFGDAREPESGDRWRVFLDVPGAPPGVMAALLEHLGAHGWRAAQPFRQTFVEAERTQWLGVHEAQAQTLNVFARQAEEVTQLWLTLEDAEEDQIGHLLGRQSHPQFHDFPEAPLPTLTLPPGWGAQMQSGHGGPIRSETVALRPPTAAPDLAGLLAHLLPQLGRQGWSLLHREDGPESLTVYRTELGVGVLTLRAGGEGVSALVVHATAEEGRGRARSIVPIP